MTSSLHRIRKAQTLIGQAHERTQQSLESMLETANHILTSQLHCPDLVLDTWTPYQVMATPGRFPVPAGDRPSPRT